MLKKILKYLANKSMDANKLNKITSRTSCKRGNIGSYDYLKLKGLINLKVSMPKCGTTLDKSFFLKLSFLALITGIFSLRPRRFTVIVLANFGVAALC